MISQDGTEYSWTRGGRARFYSAEDKCIHMVTYRKDIEREKKKELQAVTDEMTGFYTKKATERAICELLFQKPDSGYAFSFLTSTTSSRPTTASAMPSEISASGPSRPSSDGISKSAPYWDGSAGTSSPPLSPFRTESGRSARRKRCRPRSAPNAWTVRPAGG